MQSFNTSSGVLFVCYIFFNLTEASQIHLDCASFSNLEIFVSLCLCFSSIFLFIFDITSFNIYTYTYILLSL